jgi:hypothetical protein
VGLFFSAGWFEGWHDASAVLREVRRSDAELISECKIRCYPQQECPAFKDHDDWGSQCHERFSKESQVGWALQAEAARERLRARYRPARVRILFAGEAPPASGRFFYQADSGLYRAVRQTFLSAFPELKSAEFLASFRKLDCYLVDLCRSPVDRLPTTQRRLACTRAEARLGKMIRRLNPALVVTVVRSIAHNVQRAQSRARWNGTHLELPYPGRWKVHRQAFERMLRPVLRRQLGN